MLLLRNIIAVLAFLFVVLGLAILLAKLLTVKIKNLMLRSRLRQVLTIILSVATVVTFFYFYVYNGFGYQGDIYRRAQTEEKIVAFTFDDGPSPIYTPQILDILREYNIPATFFVVGAHLEKYPAIGERIAAEGHEIGNHTYDHMHVPTTAAPELSAQILKTNIEILKATGQYPDYIRPPRGFYDDRFRRLAELMGQTIVLWSLSSQDWRPGMSADGIVNRVLTKVKPGDIILFHDSGALVNSEGGNRVNTVEALPKIIEGLHNTGYRIVALEVLLAKAKPEEIPVREKAEY